MFRYLICYLGSLKSKQLICFRLVGGHFGFGHLVELAHTFGRDTPAHFLEYFFSDMKSTFKPLIHQNVPLLVGRTDYNSIVIYKLIHSHMYTPDSSLIDYFPDRFLTGPVNPRASF